MRNINHVLFVVVVTPADACKQTVCGGRRVQGVKTEAPNEQITNPGGDMEVILEVW